MKRLFSLWFGTLLMVLFLTTQAFAQTTPLVHFPADEGLHASPVEWYYYTGRLQVLGDETKAYGVEAVVFQFAIPGQPTYYAAHTAITDLDKRVLKTAQDYTFTDLRPTQPSVGFDITAGSIHMDAVGGLHHLSTTNPDYAFDLRALSLKAPTLMDGDGYEQLGNGGMFYYSYTDMAMIGTLTIQGQKRPVMGTLWHDHQWGYMASDVFGWDWFSLRLEDHTQLMGFTLRLSNGSVISAGTWVKRNGSFLQLPAGDLQITPTSSWTSPRTSATYTHGWRVSSQSLGLAVDVSPMVVDQEILYNMAPGLPPTHYWEGICDVSGTRGGKRVGGYAYVELTGY